MRNWTQTLRKSDLGRRLLTVVRQFEISNFIFWFSFVRRREGSLGPCKWFCYFVHCVVTCQLRYMYKIHVASSVSKTTRPEKWLTLKLESFECLEQFSSTVKIWETSIRVRISVWSWRLRSKSVKCRCKLVIESSFRLNISLETSKLFCHRLPVW